MYYCGLKKVRLNEAVCDVRSVRFFESMGFPICVGGFYRGFGGKRGGAMGRETFLLILGLVLLRADRVVCFLLFLFFFIFVFFRISITGEACMQRGPHSLLTILT